MLKAFGSGPAVVADGRAVETRYLVSSSRRGAVFGWACAQRRWPRRSSVCLSLLFPPLIVASYTDRVLLRLQFCLPHPSARFAFGKMVQSPSWALVGALWAHTLLDAVGAQFGRALFFVRPSFLLPVVSSHTNFPSYDFSSTSHSQQDFHAWLVVRG
jgi:hypothetical protein